MNAKIAKLDARGDIARSRKPFSRIPAIRDLLLLLGLLLIAMLATEAANAQKAQPYLLANCIITGEKLGAGASSFTYEGREIKTCCELCMEDFYKDPAGYLEKIEQAEKKAAK